MTVARMAMTVVALGVCGIAIAQQKPAPMKWDEAAAKEASAVVDRGLDAFVKMDLVAFKAVAAEDMTGYDIDLEGKPIAMKSLADCIRYVEEITAGAKKMGGTLKFDKRSTECRATSTMAFCTMSYDFVATMPDGSTIVQPSQTTAILRKGADGWKWAHWHTSLSMLPAPPAAPAGK